MHTSGHSPADKIKERITFALSHTSLYLSESDGEQDDNSVAANTFDISCCGGGPMVMEGLALHFHPSLSLYRLLMM